MKTTKLLSGLVLTALSISLFTSCDPVEKEIQVPEISTGVYVLNSGSWGYNNASLTYQSLTDSSNVVDIFTAQNERGLGDSGQDIIKYGSKLYISVTTSGIIEVVEASTGKSIKSISIKADNGQPFSPRSLAASNGKVYVSLQEGRVAKIDTVSLNIEKTIAVGPNPEGVTIANNKLYVAISGGWSAVKDSTVSVIDLNTFTELKKIKVVQNPAILKADNYGDVYVLSWGNYDNIPYTLQRIEAGTDKVTVIDSLSAYNFTICGDYAYMYNCDWAGGNKSFTIYDVKNEKVFKKNFIAPDAITNIPYSIDVDPITKNIYIGETDYSNLGKMYCFKPDGTLKSSFKTGLNPVKTIFISK